MQTIDEMNTRFGLGDRLNFELLAGDMAVINIKTGLCSARLTLQGAQVLDWTPAGHKPLIWLSRDAKFKRGKSIRGGTPICWPWFGAHDNKPDFPAHGYVRMTEWTMTESKVLENGVLRLAFELQPDKANQPMWPYNTPLALNITLGRELELELLTHNLDDRAVHITEAIHTYFAVGDIRQVTVSGLDNCEYLDKVQDFARLRQQGEIRFEAETDRVYLDTQSECVIHDAAWDRRIHIEKQGSDSTVVWNPWIDKSLAMGDMGEQGYLSMLCVESANAGSNVVTIGPGDKHRLWVRYHIA